MQDDGTGAIWAIGNGIGKPSVSLYEVGWTPENGLCMPQLAAKKYQLTFTAGVTMKTSDIDFKFFHINKWIMVNLREMPSLLQAILLNNRVG